MEPINGTDTRYCPKCGRLALVYDYHFEAYRCLNTECLVIDYSDELKGGLNDKPLEDRLRN